MEVALCESTDGLKSGKHELKGERWRTVAALLLFDLLGHLLLDAPSPLALRHLPADFLQYEYSTQTFKKGLSSGMRLLRLRKFLNLNM